MKLSTGTLVRVLLAALIFPAMAHAAQEIWLAPRDDGNPGRGTQAEPYDVGTRQKFDDLLHGYYKANTTDLIFHLAPGTYYTMGEAGGWRCLSNWRFHGAGMDLSVIKLTGWYYDPSNGKNGRNTAIKVQQAFKTGIAVTDLTIDCSWLDFGSRLAGSFTVPPPGQTVSVPVLSSTWAATGKNAYLQRMDDYSVIGLYEVTAVPDSTHVTLRNTGKKEESMRTGTKVSGPVYVGPAVNTCGIDIGAKDCDVERVRVTDTGTPVYEGPLGIVIDHINFKDSQFAYADGNVIRQCLIDNVWGSHGWCITVLSNNPTIQNGTFISAIVEDNVIRSNGKHQGLASWGTANSIWTNNIVMDCSTGWFVDVGFNKDDQIVNNSFIGGGGIQLGGGYVNGWLRFNISGNHIVIGKTGRGILFNGEVHQTVFSNNQIIAPHGGHGDGITVNPKATDGVIISNNLVTGSLINIIPTGTCFHNVTETGAPITIRK
ncbi:MAG TPA: hypothetical protein VHY22_07070 [Chthoniobacteraceae bacterium]|jgi:hypothetical protein|nr:hypothetical protein [Chthoniobacteraceae bacterium]